MAVPLVVSGVTFDERGLANLRSRGADAPRD